MCPECVATIMAGAMSVGGVLACAKSSGAVQRFKAQIRNRNSLKFWEDKHVK
jgi:hypothetical protein